MLRKSHKPVVLVVNKVDSFDKFMLDVYEFYNLGLGNPYPVSAANALGIGDVLDAIYEHFPEKDESEDEDEYNPLIMEWKTGMLQNFVENFKITN